MGQIANQPPNEIENDEHSDVGLAARSASEKKARDLVVLDLRGVASFTDYFVICTGNNARHVQSIADAVEDDLRKLGRRPLHTEGYSAAEWILLDYGDFIMHVFNPTSRKFYDLERLWRAISRDCGGTPRALYFPA